MIKHLAIVPLIALSLAACQTPQPAAPAPGATQTDKTIAELSAKLARQCNLVAVGIALGRTLNTNPKLDKALSSAEAARQQFCLAPPSDLNTAIATLADMAQAVVIASRSVE